MLVSSQINYLEKLDEMEADILEDKDYDRIAEYNEPHMFRHINEMSGQKNELSEEVDHYNKAYSDLATALAKGTGKGTNDLSIVAKLLDSARSEINQIQIDEIRDVYEQLAKKVEKEVWELSDRAI